ncbi:MAG TPA: acyltransferase family protein [Candidatus Angelobacter sp.]|nr:acyltransferase family protein [Candidatus Angelobacter sp.]
MRPENDLPYRPDIDGLRGIAVLFVVAFHAGVPALTGGFVGVDVFFVISGFLISGIIFKSLDEGHFSLAGFYAHRIRRIFPALITMLLAVWAFGWFELSGDDYRQLGWHIAGAGFISNILLWKESGYFDGAAQFKPLLHLWSLGIEEQFYLFWPLTVFLFWKTRSRVWVLALLLLGSFGLDLWVIGSSPAAAFYLPQNRLWELLIGGLAAYVSTYKQVRVDNFLGRLLFRDSSDQSLTSLQNIKASLGLLLILLAVLVLDEGRPFPGFWALLPTIGTFLLISAGPKARINQKILSNRFLVFVGLISYPLYLWHWPLLSFVRIVSVTDFSVKARAAAVAASFVLAWMTWRFVERPLRRKNFVYGGLTPVQGLVPGMLAVCLLGVLSVAKHGFPLRFPPNIRELATYEMSEHVSGWRDDQCFLSPSQGPQSFISSCTDATPGDGPLLLLWGDSHAADLYPGIHQLQSGHAFRVAQYTASNCAPIVDLDQRSRPYCREINDWVLAKVRELHPDTVVLAAQAWVLHPEDTRASIQRTVGLVQQAGVRRVILIGPEPMWKISLPRFLLRYARVRFNQGIPARMADETNQGLFQEDHDLSVQAADSGAIYLSPVSILCEKSGCLTMITENGKTDLTTFDKSHLTFVASQYLARVFFPFFFDKTPRVVN